jgi:16S rRNA pseudouridine516 synthase
MRLDKFISQQLEISRAIAGREIRSGKITVNQIVTKQSAYKLQALDEVAYVGRVLPQLQGPRYFMLHKPEGYVCATEDPQYPTILYFIDEPLVGKLHAAGRLDIDTTGLVLLTDDGQWSHRITSPRHHCAKIYHVTLAEALTDSVVRQFADGIRLQGEAEALQPAQLVIKGEKLAELTIHEGRYHQVKRMFAAVGNHVVALHRQQIGAIALDPDLQLGEYRALTEQEIASVGLPVELQRKS